MRLRILTFGTATIIVSGALALEMARAEPGAPVHSRPYAKVGALPLAEVHWTDGFWSDRLAACHRGMIPSMWEIMKGTHYKPFYEHFRIVAGLAEGDYHGAKWNDGDFYKWMEAVCAAQAVDFDPKWDKQLDEIIGVIGAAQRADGYIHTPVLVAAKNGDKDAKPFADRFNFEVYNMGHLMTTACLHHEVTGKDSLLKIARKAADFLDEAFRSPTPEQARHAICPSHYMGIIDLYRATGEPRYLKLADRLVRMRDMVEDGGDDNQDRVPLAQHTEAVGHAVRANYLYAGVADLFAETGDPKLWAPLMKTWENLVEKKMYITGGCGALHDGASPDGSKQQRLITRVHQAYGRNYQLPSTTAHNETCANIGNVLWNWRMFLASGEAKFIDVAELALYNSVLSGVDLYGKTYFYTNPLRQTYAAPVDLRWSRTRVPFVTSYCCPPNLARTVAGVGRYAYARSKGTIWVNLYGSNTLSTKFADGSALRLEQKSNYPWDGTIEIKVLECRESPFRLRLRIPGWAKSATLSVDGKPFEGKVVPGSYAELEREWKPGSSIRLELAMPPQLIESHPLVEETRNQIVIKRGPVVYCLESPDLPKGTRLADVRIPADIELKPRHDSELLAGVTVLEGTLVARPSSSWDGKLYREFQERKAISVPARFIPYYAWSNRGRSEMSVWLPLD